MITSTFINTNYVSSSNRYIGLVGFLILEDRTNGRATGTLLRPSSSSVVCL